MNAAKPTPIKADIFWASLDTPNKFSNKFQVDLCNLSEESVKALTEMGITVKKDERKPAQGNFVTAKSKNYPIIAVDEKGNPITAKIANGSKCVAMIKPYPYTIGKGVGVGVSKLIVTELIEYKPTGVGIEDLEEEAL